MPTRRELLRDLVREDARVIAEQKEKKIRKKRRRFGFDLLVSVSQAYLDK
jgi:hypothetical protein